MTTILTDFTAGSLLICNVCLSAPPAPRLDRLLSRLQSLRGGIAARASLPTFRPRRYCLWNRPRSRGVVKHPPAWLPRAVNEPMIRTTAAQIHLLVSGRRERMRALGDPPKGDAERRAVQRLRSDHASLTKVPSGLNTCTRLLPWSAIHQPIFGHADTVHRRELRFILLGSSNAPNHRVRLAGHPNAAVFACVGVEDDHAPVAVAVRDEQFAGFADTPRPADALRFSVSLLPLLCPWCPIWSGGTCRCVNFRIQHRQNQELSHTLSL